MKKWKTIISFLTFIESLSDDEIRSVFHIDGDKIYFQCRFGNGSCCLYFKNNFKGIYYLVREVDGITGGEHIKIGNDLKSHHLYKQIENIKNIINS